MFIIKTRINAKVKKILETEAKDDEEKAFKLFMNWRSTNDPIAKFALYEFVCNSSELKTKFREHVVSNENAPKNSDPSIKIQLRKDPLQYAKFLFYYFMNDLYNDPKDRTLLDLQVGD